MRTPYVPKRRLLDWPGMLQEALDRLGVSAFHLVGVSGGGPYAYACCQAQMAGLEAVGVVCGLGPFDLPSAVRAMSWEMRWGMRLTRWWPGFGAIVYRAFVAAVAGRNPGKALELYLRRHSGPDVELLGVDDKRRILIDSTREALRRGGLGAARDLVIYSTDWGFALEQVDRPIQLWHGEADPIVPVEFSREVHRLLPQAELKTYPGEGHFSMPLTRIGEILDFFRQPESGQASR